MQRSVVYFETALQLFCLNLNKTCCLRCSCGVLLHISVVCRSHGLPVGTVT
jgi:hypothetical protein